jgi:hypothetical protein
MIKLIVEMLKLKSEGDNKAPNNKHSSKQKRKSPEKSEEVSPKEEVKPPKPKMSPQRYPAKISFTDSNKTLLRILALKDAIKLQDKAEEIQNCLLSISKANPTTEQMLETEVGHTIYKLYKTCSSNTGLSLLKGEVESLLNKLKETVNSTFFGEENKKLQAAPKEERKTPIGKLETPIGKQQPKPLPETKETSPRIVKKEEDAFIPKGDSPIKNHLLMVEICQQLAKLLEDVILER